MKPYALTVLEQNIHNGSRIAIIDENGMRKTDWQALYTFSRRIAAFAAQAGLSGVVPVCMERSAEAVITLLGLNLAGVGVAPLSADTPKERISLIEAETQNRTWDKNTYLQAVNTPLSEPDGKSFCTENNREPALVIFTSGSTGVPKGVMLSNETVNRSIVRSAKRLFLYSPNDIALQTASFSFVAIILDLLSPLFAGACVHILPEICRKDAALMTDYINHHGITTTFTAPKVLRLLGKMPTMRTVIVGGERLSGFQTEDYRLINIYGMSEMAAEAFCFHVTRAYENTPIGKPDPDFECYLVDENGNLSDEGEICVSGPVSMGYYRHPELTREAFTENPFSAEKGHEMLLHSGDLARRLPDGSYLFLNRLDFMVKINGQRVEPGETEAAIKKLCRVKDVAVIGYTQENGNSCLCAYYESQQDLDIEECRSKLLITLPSYMLPTHWVRLDRFPLNANGKLNRKALIPPFENACFKEYAAPTGKTEQAVCHAYEKVLGLCRVGATDDFFCLGGDSIKAMEVSALIKGHSIGARDIMVYKTPRRLAKVIDEKTDTAAVNKIAVPDWAPLTDSQLGIYLQCILRPEGIFYNLPVKLTLANTKKHTPQSVKDAIDGVLRCHPALYSFVKPEGETMLMCRSGFPKTGICTVTRAQNAFSPEEERRFIRSFDLFKSPLCRAEVLLTPSQIILYFDCHHLVCDGTSMKLLIQEFSEALSGNIPLSESTDAFALYAMQKELETTEALQAAQKHFDALLGENETDSNLIFDKKPAKHPTLASDILSLTLHLPGLPKLLRQEGLTESSFFMGVFGYTLAKMTGQSKSLFAAAENGRTDSLTHSTVSMLVRTLPVVCLPDEEKNAFVLLRELQEQFYQSVLNGCLSFVRLAKDYGITNDVMFVYQGDMLSSDGKVEISRIPVHEAFANLALSVWKQKDAYVIQAEYREEYYEKQTVGRFLELFKRVAGAFLQNAVLKDIPLIGEEDFKLLQGFNRTQSPYEEKLTLVDLFRRQASLVPDETALVYRDRHYTYREVLSLSGRISAYIHHLGIQKGKTVSVLIPRCEYMLIASLGILTAGAVYQPLDPSYPAERLAFMCKDADSRLLIADRTLLSLLPDLAVPVLTTDQIPDLPNETYFGAPQPDDGFVLLYTSGTTGLPKGCRLLHRNARAYVHAFNTLFHMDKGCVSGAYASYGFDAHISEIYPPMSVGACLHIIPEEIRLDLPALKTYFEKNGITHTVMTTQVARQFVTEYPQVLHLRSVLCGGEKLTTVTPPESYRLTNGYGPTEATVMVSCFTLDKSYEDIPVGKALPNVKLYAVDAFMRIVPVGVPGELIAFGAQVAQGYLNRPEKTAEVFIANPFGEQEPAYQNGYKTGDIVRFCPDGNFMIMGRRDGQVKIRGFRIELTEVEGVIREYEGITDAAVLAVDEPSGGKCLHAYIVAKKKTDKAALIAFIKERKPPYMVPAAILQLDAMPYTPNLKVDKRKLPPIVSTEAQTNITDNRSKTALEESLSRILSDIVGHSNFGVETDFTRAGITSITSIRLAVQIYKQFGLHLTAKELLDGGNILSVENALVAMLLNGKNDTEKATTPKRDAYSLTQTQLGIYTDSLKSGTDTYLISLAVELKEDIQLQRFISAVETAVRAHPSMLCTIYAHDDGIPRLHPVPDLPFEVIQSHEELCEHTPTHFTFEKAPLFRFTLLLSEGKPCLLTEIHHIIADGESLRILIKDIFDAYHGLAPQPEEFTAFDLSEEEEKKRNGKDMETAKTYYDSLFRGVSADYLPCPDRFDATRLGECENPFYTPKEDIRRFCARQSISESVFFTGAFALTLARFTCHEDALFTTVHNGRGDPGIQNTVAMTVKTLPVLMQAMPECKIEDFFSDLDSRIRQLKKYDIFSFADAARTYGISSDPMFVYQGELMQNTPLGKPVKTKAAGFSKTALTLQVSLTEKGYLLQTEYNAGRFSPEWIQGFADAYLTCVNELLQKNTVGEISVCSRRAFAEFSDFNDTACDIIDRPAYRLFENSVDRHPQKTAVRAGNGSFSYRELDNLANLLARRICRLGIPKESTVILLFERTKEIYAAQLGVLKSANVFLCLSPEYPNERVRFISEDSKARAIITTHAVAEQKQELLRHLELPVLFADDTIGSEQAPRLHLPVAPDALAYMIYTSGSTGKPKGVTVMQRGLITIADNNPKNADTLCFVNDEAVNTAVCAFTFDASVMEGFVALANGSTVIVANEEQIHNPEAFCRCCLENKVTSLFGTPSFLMNLSDCRSFGQVAAGLKTVLAGGEEFTPALFRRLYELNPELCIINGYGPSEATITCSSTRLYADRRITIGKPLANTSLYCLDARNHILPMGAMGELTIVGDTVGKGYLNREDLTRRAFITVLGKPAFKTGDLAVITHGGEVEFHGRIDNQVKIRGLRVELGEIEAAINRVKDVKSAVTVVRGSGENKTLAAYFTAERQIPKEEIVAEISQSLASYMVPRFMMQLEAMPMTANGKIDKRALPEILPQKANHPVSKANTETEEMLCKLFASVLQLEEVEPEHNFFDIGGNSLLASRVVMLLQSKGFSLEYQTVFDRQTPRQLAAFLDETANKGAKGQQSDAKAEPQAETGLAEVLQYNTLSNASEVTRTPLGDTVLTGAVGFLGIHILTQLLQSESCHIYCLVRKGKFPSPQARLNAVYFYYFDRYLPELYPGRITVLDADITSENLLSVFRDIRFSAIINCAASVKHYASDHSIEYINVHGVENLITLAKSKNARLIQISTTSVAGVHTDETLKNHTVLHENQLFTADTMNNQYLISKYHAELSMLQAIKEGMHGKIIRVGNLMGRYSDGEFQMNMRSNAFLNALNGFTVIGKFPIGHCTEPMEFTPVDLAARAVVLLAGTNERFTLFHAANRFTFDEMLLMQACTRCGLPVIPTPDKEYYEEYNRLLGDPAINKYLGALVTNDRPGIISVEADNRFTADVLYRLGFSWPFMDNSYLDKVIESLKALGFFER